MSVSIALNDGCDKPGEFSVAINSFKWDGPLPVTIMPHTARTFMSKRFDPGTFVPQATHMFYELGPR
jgi:hypothetical protein